MPLRTLAELDLGPTLGLPAIIVHNVRAYGCTKCDDVLVPGPVLEAISSHVVREMLSRHFPLGGCEVRFLRKAAGLTQAELATRLGVDRVSVARWEAQEQKELAMPDSIAVRAVIAASDGKSPPVESLRHAPEAHPARFDFEAPLAAP